MSELLDQLIAATAHSLERANERLTESARGDVAYMVTELDVSIPFGGLAVEEDAVVVRLPDDDQPREGAHYVRFSVRSLPQTEETQAAAPQQLPDVTNSDISEGLTVLARAGVPTEAIRVRFDPRSKLPPGSIVKVTKARETIGTPARLTLTVSGASPGRDGVGGIGGKPRAGEVVGTPIEQVRGVGPRLAAQLSGTGFRTVEDLAAAQPQEIASSLSMSPARATAFVEAARELLS